MKPYRLAIVLDGGLVVSVVTTDPELVGEEVLLIDYDVEYVASDLSDVDSHICAVSSEVRTEVADVRSTCIEPSGIVIRDETFSFSRLAAES